MLIQRTRYQSQFKNFCLKAIYQQVFEMSGGKFKIYTKTGDKGTSSLYNGERRPKTDEFFEALGNVDELNSSVGLAREYCQNVNILKQQLEIIQCRLLDVGSAVATPVSQSSENKISRTAFDKQGEQVSMLESWIDAMDDELPPLKNFILPSGGLGSSQLHMARTICRRAERSVISLVEKELVDNQVAIYLNRLSDYLFTAARYTAMKAGCEEIVYKKASQSQ
eukprot:TRINITY_DN4902_c0_g1_i1.p1 TRINITY_DN4902_c0_g1~~TRINITY_DN4902_c0_g1_i1.p1  ORF type:complete len:223 (-),score=27.22 TRINITY_DN4902_c0_g1_i1:272-940(-)